MSVTITDKNLPSVTDNLELSFLKIETQDEESAVIETILMGTYENNDARILAAKQRLDHERMTYAAMKLQCQNDNIAEMEKEERALLVNCHIERQKDNDPKESISFLRNLNASIQQKLSQAEELHRMIEECKENQRLTALQGQKTLQAMHAFRLELDKDWDLLEQVRKRLTLHETYWADLFKDEVLKTLDLESFAQVPQNPVGQSS